MNMYDLFMNIKSEYLREKTSIFFRKLFYDNAKYSIDNYFQFLYEQNKHTAIGIHFELKYEEELKKNIQKILPYFEKLNHDEKEQFLLFMTDRTPYSTYRLYEK